MASTAQILANRENAQLSTGPVTDAGKANSSQNALALGLFTMRDFVRPNETNEYEALCISLQAELNPQTTLEQTYISGSGQPCEGFGCAVVQGLSFL